MEAKNDKIVYILLLFYIFSTLDFKGVAPSISTNIREGNVTITLQKRQNGNANFGKGGFARK